jgi:hypothetical protein
VPTFNCTPREPWTRDEILAQLDELHRAGSAFWEAFPPEAFFAPVGGGWSPAGNVRHLNKAIAPLARGLKLPRLLLRILFGKARQPSRSYSGLRDAYQATLKRGRGAGNFAPEPADPTQDTPERRAKLMATREDLSNKLSAAIRRWDDADLDRYQAPHPLLGKLTVREMLFFTVYHNYHHPHSVSTRLGEAAGAPAGKP